MSERMIEQRRAKLLAQASNGGSANTAALPAALLPNGTGGATPATPRQAAAEAMRLEDAQMARFLRLLQETRDDGQPGEMMIVSAFGPTVPTALARREIHRQGVGFCDTAVAAVVSAAADRFLASILQQSIPCRDQRLKGLEVAKQAAHERKHFRQKYEQDIADRRRRKAQEAMRRDHANRAAIRLAGDLAAKGGSTATAATTTATTTTTNAANTAKRKAPPDDEDDDDDDVSNKDTDNKSNNNKKAKKAKTTSTTTATNGKIPQPPTQQTQPTPKAATTLASAAVAARMPPPLSATDDDIDYDSVDEEDQRYIEHYAGYDDDADDDEDDNANKKQKSVNARVEEDDDDEDEDDEHEAMILRDIARPLRAWGFNVDGKLTASANIFTVVNAAVVAATTAADDSETDVVGLGEAGPFATEESASANGPQLQVNGDGGGGGGPNLKEDAAAENGSATTGKPNHTGTTAASSIATNVAMTDSSPAKKTKSADASAASNNNPTTKSPSSTTVTNTT